MAYSFDLALLQENLHTFIEYTTPPLTGRKDNLKTPVENFIDTDDPRIKWSRQVKASLKKLEPSSYEDAHFRWHCIVHFVRNISTFDNFWNEERYQQHNFFPYLRLKWKIG